MKNNRGSVLVVVIIIVCIIIGISMVSSENTLEENNTNIEVSSNVISISEISFEENYVEIDLKESKIVVLKVNPPDADKENLKYNSTNSEVAIFEKNVEKSDEDILYIEIQPISEGECEVFATYNNIESNKIKVKVIDNDRIEREKKEAEEQAKKQIITQSSTTTTQKSNSSSQSTAVQQNTGSSTSQSNSNNTHGKTVYRTPSGKRYHFDPDCGGKNSYSTTLSAAISAGLTPCQKCAK